MRRLIMTPEEYHEHLIKSKSRATVHPSDISGIAYVVALQDEPTHIYVVTPHASVKLQDQKEWISNAEMDVYRSMCQ